jgi:hypothetical protein
MLNLLLLVPPAAHRSPSPRSHSSALVEGIDTIPLLFVVNIYRITHHIIPSQN